MASTNLPCPCHKCHEREIGCHSICRRYIAWKADNDEAKDARQKEYVSTYDPERVRKECVDRWKKTGRGKFKTRGLG